MNKCKPGVTADQQQICPDVDAVGIQSISQSADKTKLYITLTDGTTQTFTLPAGATGATGAAGANGKDGEATLYNDLTITGTALNTLAVVKSYTLPANYLTVGSELRIRTYIELIGANTCGITVSFGGIDFTNGTGLDIINPTGGNDIVLQYEFIVSNTASGAFVEIKRYATDGVTVHKSYKAAPNGFAPNFTIANTIDISLLCDIVGSPVGANCKQLEVILYQFEV